MDLRPFLLLAVALAAGAFFAASFEPTQNQDNAKNIVVNASLAKETFLVNEPVLVLVTASGAFQLHVEAVANGERKAVSCNGSLCRGEVSFTFEKKGVHFVEVVAETPAGESASKKIAVRVVGAEKSCADGTLAGACSKNPPFFCTSEPVPVLEENCEKCGCMQGLKCQDGSCADSLPNAELISVSGSGSVYAGQPVVFSAGILAKEEFFAGQKIILSGLLFGSSEKKVLVEVSLPKLNKEESFVQEISVATDGLLAGNYSFTASIAGLEKNSEKTIEDALVVKAPDNVAPKAPTWLEPEIAEGSVTIKWFSGGESDLKEFLVYESSRESEQFIAYSLRESVPAQSMQLKIAEDFSTKHFFVIKSVDWSQNQSGFSSVLEVGSQDS